MSVNVPIQGEGTLENTTVALNYDDHFSDIGYSPNPFDDAIPTPFYDPPRHSVGVLSNVGDHPSALEAMGRSSGSMEQEEFQAFNSNINSENESPQLNEDPGLIESKQRKRKCSSVAAASRISGLMEPVVPSVDGLFNTIKNYGNQLSRIIVKDREKEKDKIFLKIVEINTKDDPAFAELRKKILLQEWPVEIDVGKTRTDVNNVKKSIEEAKKDGSFQSKAAELEQEVVKMGEAIKALQKKREGKLNKRKLKCDINAQAKGISSSDLNAQGVSSSDLNACGLNAQAQGISSSDLTAQGVSSSDLNACGLNAQAQVQAQAQGISSSRTSYEEDSCEYAEDFLKKLLGKENNNVDFSNFKCFQVTCDNLPTSESYVVKLSDREAFSSIDKKLRKLCGKGYEVADLFAEEKLLVLAAIKEMEEVKSLELVDESILLKWGAAFNKAERAGYHMDFAKKQLEVIARAFFGSQSRIKEKFIRLQKLVKAASDVEQMASYTDGMFASHV